MPLDTSDPDAFVAHWSKAEASERANAQPFLIALAGLLDVPVPDNSHAGGYSFEFPVRIPTGPATHSDGRIDLYRRRCFVLEAKQFADQQAEQTDLTLASVAAGARKGRKSSGPVRGSGAWDSAMILARAQAERYARALPADEPTPPFLLVVDVGHTIEVYADFTQAGKSYLPFPDLRTFRLKLADLREEKIRERLRRVWTDPLSLDPAKVSAAVTREIAGYLAVLASSLEKAGHTPRLVSEFLTRCLFCMFAEDVGLLPADHRPLAGELVPRRADADADAPDPNETRAYPIQLSASPDGKQETINGRWSFYWGGGGPIHLRPTDQGGLEGEAIVFQRYLVRLQKEP